MSKNTPKQSRITRRMAKFLQELREKNFLIIGGSRELTEKLEFGIFLAKQIDPERWMIVTRGQIHPEQFPYLLPKRFPGKKLLVLLTWESFLPDFEISREDLYAISAGLQQICIDHDLKVIAIMNSVEDDEFWTRLSEEEIQRTQPHVRPTQSIH